LEAERVIFIRKEPPTPEARNGNDVAEYKENETPDADETVFDPTAFSFTKEQIAAVTKDIAGIRGITPRYSINGEYITIDGAKKYQVHLGMLSEGITQKTEAGRTIDGKDQI